jgi:hypothetical protein
LANDSFWQQPGLPWNCSVDHCDCRVSSLSNTEMARYVQEGCSPGDEEAALTYSEWQRHSGVRS